MQVHSGQLRRLCGAPMRAAAIGTIFETIARAVNEFGAAMSSVTIDYQDKDDVVVEGDLVPVITLSLRPVTLPVESPSIK